ncbi:MAG: ABC transporter ATP-binding protein [Clostridia bacterium]
MIELHNVSKFYSNKDTVSTGFSKVDLNLDMGEFVVITGESGSGKSTLLNVISGLDSYEEGELFIAGEDTSGYRTEDYERYRKKYIGNIFQDFNLVNSYTVYQNVELSMMLSGMPRSEQKQNIPEYIEMVDMTAYTKTKASKLSGGQKQRVAIARALAKNAPVIVADEPTGNLDSASAEKVMETLHRISKDRLVVIVTHNYEQAAPYVTRKITMHDGRIIEDKKLQPAAGDLSDDEMESYLHPEEERPVYRKMSAGSQLRLGVRNTFNLPAKFILLLLVYLFVTAAVLSQYASTKQALHSNDLMGYNNYFTDTSPERLILTKKDGSAFTTSDYESLQKMDNADYIIKGDAGIDTGIMFESDDIDISGPMYPVSCLKEKPTIGRLPKKDTEVVLVADPECYSYDAIKEMDKKILGKKYYIDALNSMAIQGGDRLIKDKVTVVGVVFLSEDAGRSSNGNVMIYVTDNVAARVLVKTAAASSAVTLDFSGTKSDYSGMQVVYPSKKVPKGEVYISEDQAFQFYEEGAARGKTMGLHVKNHYFEESRDFRIGQVFKADNIRSLLGLSKNNYDEYTSNVYINPSDYNKIFNQGNFQSSFFMKDEKLSDSTVKALEGAGYKVLVIKDTFTDATGGYAFILRMFSMVRLALEFIVLFFISYAVIRLIMRSRNSYYSTLRILGASRKNTDNILRIELLLMMAISYGGVLVGSNLVRRGIVAVPAVNERLAFLSATDYFILFVGLLVMSLLIAKRYSHKIFSKSAMKVYREEA